LADFFLADFVGARFGTDWARGRSRDFWMSLGDAGLFLGRGLRVIFAMMGIY
jgi:hypothetical protein